MSRSHFEFSALSAPVASRRWHFSSLLTPDGYSPKLNKGRARNYASAVLHLAPASLSGRNVCRWSSAGCRAGCLNTAGRGGILKAGETTNNIQRARIARTDLFFADRPAFMAQLAGEIARHIRRAVRQGMTPAVRLNGTSDLPYERIRMSPTDARTIFEVFPGVQFYDYTKSAARALTHAAGQGPANYHLTFSRSESNALEVGAILAAGGNVAAVFAKALPAEWNGSPVVNGDQDDLRFLDPSGVVVGLKAKGRARRDASGFVVQTARAIVALPMLVAAPQRPAAPMAARAAS
jgi:hypothetical protein